MPGVYPFNGRLASTRGLRVGSMESLTSSDPWTLEPVMKVNSSRRPN